MRRFLPGKKVCWGGLIVLAALAALAVWQKDRILSWHYLRQLAAADEANRETWVNRVVALGEPCLPGLVGRLKDASAPAGANLGAGMEGLLISWGPDDGRTHRALAELVLAFPACSSAGKEACLSSVRALIERQTTKHKLPGEVAKGAADLLSLAQSEADLTYPSLRLARVFMSRVPSGQGLSLCRGLVAKGLGAPEVQTRLAAIQVMIAPAFHKDQELLEKAVPLLKDKAEDVRKAALLALAAAPDVVGDDELLALLHDPSVEIQHHCVLALQSRGLKDSHILLAKLISDPSPAERMKVLDHLHHAPDLEPGVWLERLSQDAVPAVRAAAVRAVANESFGDLRGRLSEMAGGDPSPTVRQLARFYLTRAVRRHVDE